VVGRDFGSLPRSTSSTASVRTQRCGGGVLLLTDVLCCAVRAGCDVITTHQDSIEAAREAQARRLFAVGAWRGVA